MRIGGLAALVIAIVLGALAAVAARAWLEGRAVASVPNVIAQQSDKKVVVASQPITFGTPLTRQNLKEIRWAAGAIPAGSFASLDELLKPGRRVALGPLEVNEPILDWKVTGPGQRASLSALIDEGKKAVTVRVDDVRGVAGFVLPGERVDLILTRGGENSAFSDVLLQNVRVLAVDQIANESREQPTVAKAVTLEVTTEQAQKVIVASTIGRLSMILRQAGSVGPEAIKRVSAADLNNAEFVNPATAQSQREVAIGAGPVPAELKPPVINTQPDRNFSFVGVFRALNRDEYRVLRERN